MSFDIKQRRLPEPDTVDVLFVAYGGGHIRAILPVAKTLKQRGYNVCVFAMTSAIDVCYTNNIPYFTYADLPQSSEEDVLREGARLAATLPAGGTIPVEETYAYMGVNFIDLVMQHGFSKADTMFDTGGRQNFFPINNMMSCLAYLRPRMLITTNSPRSEHAALKAASQLNIPSLCVVDLFALNEISWLKTPGLGTKMCVLNDAVRDMFIREGRPADDIEVTGNPAFDVINDPAIIQEGHDLRSARGWGKNKRTTILYASSPEPEIHPFTKEIGDILLPSRIEEQLRNILKNRDDIELVLRRHPSEKQEVKVGDRIHASAQSDDINALMHAVDMVVVTGSTVGLQAYFAGVPVISIECSTTWKDLPLADFGMAQRVQALENLEEKLLAEITRLKLLDTSKVTKRRNIPVLATCNVSDIAVDTLQTHLLPTS